MSIPFQSTVSQSLDPEKLNRIIRFAIGFDSQLENTRGHHRLWKLFEYFPDEDSARVYFEEIIWPNGPICPRCRSGNHLGSGTKPYRCNACNRQFTVRIGTIFQRSHISLQRWLWAIVVLAAARRKVSSAKLAAVLMISQPAASGMIRKLKDDWRNLSHKMSDFLRRDLDFVDFPISWKWPFFSGRPRFLRPKISESGYLLAAEDVLIFPDGRSPEKKTEGEAIRKLKEKIRKAEDWARRLKRGSKSVKRFVGWLAFWKKRHKAHGQDHLKWIPFKWMTRRDCPACRFGEREWRHWEAVVVQFDLVLWEEFWDWIEDLNLEAKQARERPYEDRIIKEVLYVPEFLRERFDDPSFDRKFIEKWRATTTDVKRRYIRIAIIWERQIQQRDAETARERERIREQQRLRSMADVAI